MKISIMIEGQMGVNWEKWQALACHVEDLGFTGLFRSDHFTNSNPPDQDSLEAFVSLAYLASATNRIYFGTLVSPFSFRDPVMLARQAMAINALSGGRMILGVGAGWQAREHSLFGYDLGDIPARFQRMDEGLQVVISLIRNPGRVTFTGKYYNLADATLLPSSSYQVPILVGGNGRKRTLPLAARYADIWNAVGLSVNEFRERSDTLNGLATNAGRQPSDIRRTIMVPVLCWRSQSELEERTKWLRKAVPAYSSMATDEILNRWRNQMSAIVGNPSDAADKIRLYEEAGADEIMMQWLSIEDLEGISILAQELLHLQT